MRDDERRYDVQDDVDGVLDDEVERVRDALVCLYGAAAAVMRGDGEGVSLLLEDLAGCFTGIDDELIAISLATLERLEAAVGAGPCVAATEGRPIAQELLTLAGSMHRGRPDAVQVAAWRLDAVRQGDRRQVAADLAGSRAVASDRELVLGAIALLAATVVLWARRTGQSSTHAVSDLCLAASLEVVW